MNVVHRMTVERVRNKISKSRKERGMSLDKLAKDIGISYVYLYQIETGIRGLSVKNLLKIAKGLGMKPHTLLKPED